MSILDKLATTLQCQDEVPNQELAQYIAEQEDEEAVRELMDHLQHKNKSIQSDCIKVLYEIGDIKPALIANYSDTFLQLLDGPNNRLVWGAMTALDAIVFERPQVIFAALSKIIAATNQGSVITKNHGINILIKLASMSEYADQAFNLLMEQLKHCPTNQLPKYVENAVSILQDNNKALFVSIVSARLVEIEKETKRKRVEKVLRKLV
ncbi:hypothetical protein [Paenibacillus yanchengensis]|uniref:HEAT repeat domain-containing protein n=1 Tax=Paenibacillus yanchengensis TaxID=2035833 RepID=A0ABW4YHP2_9BACL